MVYGGSEDADVESTSITMLGGLVGWVYPGGWNGKVTGTATYTMTGGKVENGLGGGGALVKNCVMSITGDAEVDGETKIVNVETISLTVGGNASIEQLPLNTANDKTGVDSFAIAPDLGEDAYIRLTFTEALEPGRVVATGAVAGDVSALGLHVDTEDTQGLHRIYLDGTEIKVQKVPTHTVEGTITGTGTYTDVNAILRRNDRFYRAAMSGFGSSFNYTATDVPEGIYNLVVTAKLEGETVTVTTLVTVDAAVTKDVTLPNGKFSSEVTYTGTGVNPVEAGGLDAIANTLGTANPTVKVLVELYVAWSPSDMTPDSIKDAVAASGKESGYLVDIALTKKIGAASSEAIHEADDLIDIVLHLSSWVQGKTGYTVYRYHDNKVDTITETPNSDGEKLVVGENGSYLLLSVKKFSPYVVAFNEEAVPPPVDNTPGITTCAITATAGEGGSISPNGTVRVNRGSDKTFTIKPNEGYVIADVLVDGKSVLSAVTLSGGEGSYTFEKVTAKHTIEAAFRKKVKNPFTDVTEDDWFYDAVIDLYEKGLMTGTAGDSFSPLMNTDRAAIVTILWRLEGMPSSGESSAFPDVPVVAWYAQAVAWAHKAGVVEGYDTGKFGPADPITREQLAAILWRYAGSPTVLDYEGTGRFTDTEAISPWAAKAVTWALSEGILTGRGDGILDPTGKAARAEAAAMVERFIKKS